MPDPDDIPRSVVTLGAIFKSRSFELESHSHRKAQFMMSLSGTVTCEAAGALWIVPPRCALWIPPGVRHRIKGTGTIENYSAFIDPALTWRLPPECRAMAVSPLLRELVIRSAGFTLLYPEPGFESHVISLLLEEMAQAPVSKMQHVPVPEEPRLRKVLDALIHDPADRGTLETWAKYAGLSERTMSRLVLQETGMTFGRWRQRVGIVCALEWMAKGMSIQQAAINLGYESAGGFVNMFRKAMGITPGRYMAEMASEGPGCAPSSTPLAQPSPQSFPQSESPK